MSRLRNAPLVAALSLLAMLRASGQGSMTMCDLDAPGGVESETIGGLMVTKGSGGITVRCRSRNLVLLADSGRIIGEERVELYGHVRYKEQARIDLQSDLLTYFVRDERVEVRGHVIATLPSGSTLVAPEATYLRAVAKVRLIEELTAIKTATVTIAAKGDSGKPVAVTATRIYMRGDSLIYASRNVVIARTDLLAKGDSAFLDGRRGTETMRLMYKPSVEGLQGRKFKLEGGIIDAYSRERKLERVIARGSGHATSKDLDITADTLDLRISNDAMERAIAWSYKGQAVATSPDQSISADSLDVIMPKQKVTVVHAIRRAFAQAAADTVRFRTKEKDWLSGDTVRAWFDTTTTKDTTSTPPIRQIVATHRGDSARAYYHLPANDTATHDPAISYVRGRKIQLDFENRKVTMVTVRDSVAGMYLEPKRDTAKTAAPPKSKTASASTKTPAKTPVSPPAKSPVKPPAKPPAKGQQ